MCLLGLVGATWLGWAWWCRRSIAFSSVTVVCWVYLAAYAVAAALSLDPRRSLNALCLTTLYALVWVLVSDLIHEGWSFRLFIRVMTIVATGVVGALAATATHSLFDTPPAVPVNAIVIATLTAILTTQPRPVER